MRLHQLDVIANVREAQAIEDALLAIFRADRTFSGMVGLRPQCGKRVRSLGQTCHVLRRGVRSAIACVLPALMLALDGCGGDGSAEPPPDERRLSRADASLEDTLESGKLVPPASAVVVKYGLWASVDTGIVVYLHLPCPDVGGLLQQSGFSKLSRGPLPSLLPGDIKAYNLDFQMRSARSAEDDDAQFDARQIAVSPDSRNPGCDVLFHAAI